MVLADTGVDHVKVARYPQMIAATYQISPGRLVRSQVNNFREAYLLEMHFQLFGHEETQPRFTKLRDTSAELT
jgi:hypothetical protein